MFSVIYSVTHLFESGEALSHLFCVIVCITLNIDKRISRELSEEIRKRVSPGGTKKKIFSIQKIAHLRLILVTEQAVSLSNAAEQNVQPRGIPKLGTKNV